MLIPSHIRYSALLCGLIASSICCCTSATRAADRADVLAPFVNDDTFAVAYVDAASLKVSQTLGDLPKLLPLLGNDAQPVMFGVMRVDGIVQRFRDAGGESLYIVVGLGDLPGNGPVGIATARAGEDPAKIEQLFRAIENELSAMGRQQTQAGANSPVEIARKGDIVIIGQKQSVARYSRLKSAPRPDLIEALNRAIEPPGKPQSGRAVIAATLCPGADFRRVIRELWPKLPGVLAPMRGELADRWISLELAVSAPPNSRPRLALQAKDPEAAELFAKLWRDLPTAVTEFGGNETSRKQAQKYAQLLVDTLPPKVDGSRATFDLSIGEEQSAKLSAMFAEAAEKSMEVGYRNQKVNSFKELAIAMHNYHDKFKHFPPSAIRDKDGKPLLSWRVAILPFIDQQLLYSQFHLNEPWDSPHNRTLIAKMPATYADPNPRRRHDIGEGKTTYQVPVSPETAFGKSEGVKLSEITDGTSQTIMIVDVGTPKATEWTKPADWDVDLAHPLQDLQEPNRKYFVATRCDGSAHVVPMTIKEKTLRSLLTSAGQDVPEEQVP